MRKKELHGNDFSHFYPNKRENVRDSMGMPLSTR